MRGLAGALLGGAHEGVLVAVGGGADVGGGVVGEALRGGALHGG